MSLCWKWLPSAVLHPHSIINKCWILLLLDLILVSMDHMKFSYFSLNMLNVISWFSNINLALNLGLRITWHICQDPYVCDGELSFSCTVVDLGRNVNTHFKMNLEVFSPFAYAVCTFLSVSPTFWGNGSVESLVLLMFLSESFKNYKFKFSNKYKAANVFCF